MDNSMDGMLGTYLFETNSLLDSLDEILVTSEKDGELSEDSVNEIFRIMHTIKGSSAMMEFDTLSTIAHKIEDLFFYIREQGMAALADDDKTTLFDLLFESEDYLRSEVEKVEAGEVLGDEPGDFKERIEDFLSKISVKEKPAKTETENIEKDAKTDAFLPDDPDAVCFIKIFIESGVGMENLRSFMLVTALKDSDMQFRHYPEDIESNSATSAVITEQGLFLAFDSEEDAYAAADILKMQPHIASMEMVENKPPVVEEKKENNIKKEEKPKKTPKKISAPVKQSLISVDLRKLDSLMDIVGEIVITESMVTSSPVLKNLPQDQFDLFMKSARQLRKLTDDLQDIAMSLRMVPISGVFQKMNRIIRDMKHSLNKDVALTIIGENTEVDKTIVDSIQDPIMHIVRNAMDHGIEATAEERLKADKDPQGKIVLEAAHTGNEIVITVSDDGYGIDAEKILDKAENKGLLTKAKEKYSKKEALGLILLPGFSTNKDVTEYSGRGVGMDVVKKNVEAVGGNVTISSELGKGTTITLRIPLTLAIVDGMKVTVGDSIFTIPIVNIRQSFKITENDIVRDECNHEIVECMGDFYPVIRLNEFYGIESGVKDIKEGILIWVEFEENSYCVFVDDLVGEQQVVVKPLPTYVNSFDLKHSGIIGCTILGNGSISIILDIPSLYYAAEERF